MTRYPITSAFCNSGDSVRLAGEDTIHVVKQRDQRVVTTYCGMLGRLHVIEDDDDHLLGAWGTWLPATCVICLGTT